MISASTILNEWGFETEEELIETFERESLTGICLNCRKEVPWEKCIFVGGDPYCKKCYNGDRDEF